MINKVKADHQEILKIGILFERLAETREQLKTEEKAETHDWIDRWNTWSLSVMVWSSTPIIGIFVAVAIVTLFLGAGTNPLSWWLWRLFDLSMIVTLLAMLSFLFSQIAFFVKLFKRSESQKAKESFAQIQPYLKYGAEISREFSLETLYKAEKGLRQEATTFNNQGNFVMAFLEKLPSALWWITIFVIFNFSLNFGRFREILTIENDIAFNKFQEALINFVFFNTVNFLSPFFVFNLKEFPVSLLRGFPL